MYDQISVLLAAGITASATIGLTLYAIFTKSEFTSYWQGLTGTDLNYFRNWMVFCDVYWIFDHS